MNNYENSRETAFLVCQLLCVSVSQGVMGVVSTAHIRLKPTRCFGHRVMILPTTGTKSTVLLGKSAKYAILRSRSRDPLEPRCPLAGHRSQLGQTVFSVLYSIVKH